MDEQQSQQPDEQPTAGAPPPQVGTSRGTIIFVIVLVAIAIIFSLFFSGMFGLYGGPGG